jgi:hypothetical protein
VLAGPVSINDISPVLFVIPGLTRNPVSFWIPAPRFHGGNPPIGVEGRFILAKAGAGMTDFAVINVAVYRKVSRRREAGSGLAAIHPGVDILLYG